MIGRAFGFATHDLAVHADGQIVGNLTQTFTVKPRALKMYAPREKR